MKQYHLQDDAQSTQSNDLIRSVWSLDSVPLKIFEIAVSKIDPYNIDKQNTSVYLSKKALFKLFKAKDNDKYSRFQAHLKRLQKQVITIKDYETKKIVQIVPIPTIKYGAQNDDDVIEFQFNPNIMPFLVDLKQNYTAYQIQNIKNMSSKYAILLYKFIKMNAWRGNATMVSTMDYRRYTDTTERYKLFSDFEKRVLVDAITDLNASGADILVTYEKHKSGRYVQNLSFKWRLRENYREKSYDNDEIQYTIDDF
jgi:plasmid replication initiation protein